MAVEIKVTKTAVSRIDANRCVNCGTCSYYCPVGAISERQKAICHLCPDCTEMNAITPDKVIEMQSNACTLSCPLGLSPQGFIGLLKAGRDEEAFQHLWNKNPLPAVCGYICHHPCEQDCKRGTLVDRPMEIRAIQRFLSEKFIDYVPAPYPVIYDERIAIIGAGPAGITAAHMLSKKGYRVTVFEQGSEAGGMLLRCLPDFRLDKDIVRKEISRLEKAGIRFILNAKLDETSLDQLRKDYDRIIVATGNPVSKTLPLPNNRAENVWTAVNVMERVNSGKSVHLYGHVVVIGGGSVAVDTARTAVRLGAEKVTMICLESGKAVPAHQWELEEASAEGIDLIEGISPTRILGTSSDMRGVEYIKIKNLDPKTFHFDKVEGSDTELAADFVIFAIGQKPEIKWPRDGDLIFAGDIAGDQCSVIDAMASGLSAAISADNELRGHKYRDYEVERTVEAGELEYKIYPAMRQKLDFEPPYTLDAETRKKSFETVEKTFAPDKAELETWRCMQCGYHYIDPEVCIGCGVCMKVCPKGDVISMVAYPQNGREEQ